LGAKTEGRKAMSGTAVLGEGAADPPYQLGLLKSAVTSPAGFGSELRPPKVFPLFSALRAASANTITLSIVDCRVAIGAGQRPPCPTCAHPGGTFY